METGVYSITTPTINDFVYIGSAARKPFKRRWTIHRSALAKGVHHSPSLQAVVRECGLSVLRFEVLECCAPADCLKREQYWIDSVPINKRYNVNPRAESRLGSKFTEAQREQLRKSHGGIASAQLRAQILAKYLNGARQSVLAKEYNVTRGTIKNYLQQASIAIRPQPKRNEKLRIAIVGAYNAGQPIKGLAKVYGLDYETILRILQNSGVKLRNSSLRQKLRFKDIEVRKRLSILHGGRSVRFIHRDHGVFTGHAIELASRFDLSGHNLNSVIRGEHPAYKGWEICNGEPHIWKRPEHREYPRGTLHPNFGKVLDAEIRQNMARRNRKCSDAQIREIRALLRAGVRQAEIAESFGVDQSVISRINTGARHYAEFVD